MPVYTCLDFCVLPFGWIHFPQCHSIFQCNHNEMNNHRSLRYLVHLSNPIPPFPLTCCWGIIIWKGCFFSWKNHRLRFVECHWDSIPPVLVLQIFGYHCRVGEPAVLSVYSWKRLCITICPAIVLLLISHLCYENVLWFSVPNILAGIGYKNLCRKPHLWYWESNSIIVTLFS